jgi:hypothetical protein
MLRKRLWFGGRISSRPTFSGLQFEVGLALLLSLNKGCGVAFIAAGAAVKGVETLQATLGTDTAECLRRILLDRLDRDVEEFLRVIDTGLAVFDRILEPLLNRRIGPAAPWQRSLERLLDVAAGTSLNKGKRGIKVGFRISAFSSRGVRACISFRECGSKPIAAMLGPADVRQKCAGCRKCWIGFRRP